MLNPIKRNVSGLLLIALTYPAPRPGLDWQRS